MHYRIDSQGRKRYLSTNPELALAHNWTVTVDRLAASTAAVASTAITPITLDGTPCDSDTAYKGMQCALGISLVGLVGLAAWALFSL